MFRFLEAIGYRFSNGGSAFSWKAIFSGMSTQILFREAYQEGCALKSFAIYSRSTGTRLLPTLMIDRAYTDKDLDMGWKEKADPPGESTIII